MDIRFVGQEHTLTVPVPAPGGAVEREPEPVAERFLDEYERTFGSILDEELEIVCVRAICDDAAASATARRPQPTGSQRRRLGRERYGAGVVVHRAAD